MRKARLTKISDSVYVSNQICNLARKMASRHKLDPHARPPDAIKSLYKRLRKAKQEDLAKDGDILDFQREDAKLDINLKKAGELKQSDAQLIFQDFDPSKDHLPWLRSNCPISGYEHTAMPGME